MHDRMYGAESRGQTDWKVIYGLLPYLWEFRLRVIVAMSFLIIAKLANVAVPVLLKHIVDALDKSRQPEVTTLIAIPLALLLAYGLLRFSSVLFGELRDAVFGLVAERSLTRIGLVVFRHLHKLDLEYHLSRRTGGLSRDIERGTSGVSFLLRSLVFSVIPILVEVALVIGIFIWQFDAGFAWITLGGIVAYVAFSVSVTNWRTEFVRTANLKDSQANTKAVDSLLNFETVKYFTNEEFEARRYGDSLTEREQAKIKNTLSLASLNAGQSLIIAVTLTLMMIRAAQQVADGTMTLGDLAMVNALMIQVFIPLNVLGFVYREIKRALADVEAMFDILKVEPSIRDADDAVTLPADADGICFDNVSFSYQPDRPILKNLSFTVPPGHKVAIVGASGAGKSTISRLLFRFYDVQAGAVMVGGKDVRALTQDSLRRAIGVVPQDTVLFNDTIQANIQYGNPDASESEVREATRLAFLDPFIEKLPKGYDTKVGERGLKVSGGEKQRIAIARTLLKRPRILLFDEATSSLDSHAEQAIAQALNQVARNHTTLVIAHRLSTVVDADEIIVLDSGSIVERGSHAELLKRDGAYARMWRIQHEKSEN
ncbi:MAG: ABC transporter ATP-binding protein/permease [Gammaproteobacteria bacterium]|nr:ABC transporter ATP-binding protein/permease [Gammaproteobacteria bacterium]